MAVNRRSSDSNLLALMFGAGVTSSVWGFTIGREALQGTTQPDVRPSNNAGSGKPGKTASKDQVSILKEKDILTTVKARVEGRDPEKTAGANNKTEKASSKPAAAKKPAAKKAKKKAKKRSAPRKSMPKAGVAAPAPAPAPAPAAAPMPGMGAPSMGSGG